ncbi:hypothetical protein GWO53_00665 [Corynebacterium macginleyi]|nr:hypothetical protein [Corynebacterium macginleyi]MBK4139063.1 hypothetical protein [Corynebacterium macginleyi]MBK4163322.1 hypothetical protein [Corynebacterium macginleyi]
MIGTLVNLSSSLDFEAIFKAIKGVAHLSSESNSDSAGLSSVFDGLSSKGGADAATDSVATATETAAEATETAAEATETAAEA